MGSVSPLPTSRAPMLVVSEALRLPLDAATETFGIVGVKGSGKTTTARVLVEELLERGQQAVVVDPLGVWWGLRAAADGQGPGLPVTILGGDHGDLPISPDAGEVLADLAVDEPAPLVLDLSVLRKGEQRRLMTAFLERLYHRNRNPLHLVVDEADLYGPQRPMRGDERLLGAMEDLVRRGRAKGLGVTLITQRPAVLHKDLLSQVGCLVAHRLVGPQDRAAIDAWVQAHGTREQRDELMASIASLPTGTAWFWSPAWLDLFARVPVRAPRTFDSSATPKAGRRVAEPAALAPVDLDALQERMAAVVARAEQTDPRALQRRVRDLQRDLVAARAAQSEPERVVERVEVPMLPDELVDRLEVALTRLTDATSDLAKISTELTDRLSEALGGEAGPVTTVVVPKKTAPANRRTTPAAHPPTGPPATSPGHPLGVPRTPPVGEVALKAGAHRILETLARQHPVRVTRAQLATLAGFKVSGGTFQSYFSALRTAGFIEEVDRLVSVTEAGYREAGYAGLSQPMTTAEVLEVWRAALKRGARDMLDHLVDVYPAALSRQELAQRLGMVSTGGTFQSYLSTLRTNGLAEVHGGEVRASESLFMGEQ